MRTQHRPFTITYDAQPVRVWPVNGYRDIVHDADGCVYTPQWDRSRLAPYTTPAGRAGYRWRPRDRVWVCYRGGLVEFERGMRQAILSGQKSIPPVEELERIIASTRAEVVYLNELSAQKRGALKRKITRASSFMFGAKAPELKESRGFIARLVLFRDSRGRLNTCAVLMRLDAVTERLYERLDGICAWTPVLGARLMLVNGELNLAYARVRRLHFHADVRVRQVQRLLDSKDPAREVARALAFINEDANALDASWARVLPYVNWARRMKSDYTLLARSLTARDFTAAGAIARRLAHAAKLKELQIDLDGVIEELSLAAVAGHTPDTQRLLATLRFLYSQVRTINDRDWKNPVIKPICDAIAHGGKLLATDQELAKEELKTASRLF